VGGLLVTNVTNLCNCNPFHLVVVGFMKGWKGKVRIVIELGMLKSDKRKRVGWHSQCDNMAHCMWLRTEAEVPC
jgi:hypothetical protein